MSPGSDVEGSYSAIHEQLKQESDERLLEMSDALVRFIGSRDWQIQLGEMRGMVDSGQSDSMINLLTEPGAGKVSESLERIDNYIERGRYSLAMDEAFFAIEFGPGHVPLHERMADILTLDRKPSAAAEKYNMIANTLMMRGDMSKAADIFAKVLHLSPMDVAARRRLIEMLLDQKRTLDGLQQYKELAEIYLTMADTESARKTYQEAVDLAQRDSVEPELIAELLYEIGDLDSQRLDWQQALRSYEQIKSLLPGDEKASMAIVDLYFRLGQETEAIQQLDQYLSYCFSNGLSDRVVIVLEEQVRNRADEIALRQRLAKVYQQQNRMSDAIAQMDALGELLLEANRREEAVATIKQIISFDPPDVEGYRQLLQQLEG